MRKQPIWAAGDTPHLMPVEQGLPWHPVAMGLAGQAPPPPPRNGCTSNHRQGPGVQTRFAVSAPQGMAVRAPLLPKWKCHCLMGPQNARPKPLLILSW